MSDLTQLQDDFQAYILDYDPRIDDQVVGTKKASAEERLEIYSNAYRFRLLDIVIDDYSKLASLLGDEQILELGADYIDAYPSKFFSVRWFGQYMSEFLQNTDPYSQQPILAEIAKFECGLMKTFDAPDNTLITMDDLANIPPNDWANICFTFTASLQRLDLQWNTAETWKSLDAEQPPPSPQKSEFPQAWMLWRKDLDPHFRSLPVEEAWAIDAAMKGQSFGDICEGLCEWLDEQHVPAHAASLLKGWIAEEIVADIT